MGAPEVGTVVSVEFEVYGNVQGQYFTKYCRERCEELGVSGWIKNSKKGTILGKLQGTRPQVEMMTSWLANTGSPGCKIDRCELTRWENLAKADFKGFSIRF